MPDFRTPVNISPAPFQLAHEYPVLLTGSCFTAHIGARLDKAKFRTLTNPLGILYNPVSLAKSLTTNPVFTAADFFEQEGRWRNWDLHSELAHTDLQTAVDNANEAAARIRDFVKTAGVLVITLGTASVFALESTGEIVANCHKMPAKRFRRYRLSVDTTTQVLSEAITAVKSINPHIRVILTVSPVRHLREGAVDNQRSKAVLCLACEALAAAHPEVYYFPAYELLLDDLRDYRFYGNDMIHPSDTAVQYIWDHFAQTFFSETTRTLLQRIDKITAAVQHRPFNPHAPQHLAFLEKQRALVTDLEKTYPFLDFSNEKVALGGG